MQLSAPASANRKLSNVFAFKRNLNNKRKLSQNPQLALLSPAVLTTEFAFSPTRGSPKLDHEKSLNASISAGTRNNQFLNVTPTRQSQITLEIEDSDRSHIDGGNSERDFKSEFGELEGDLGEPDDDDDDDDSEDEDEGIGDSDDVEIPLIKSYKDNKRAKNKVQKFSFFCTYRRKLCDQFRVLSHYSPPPPNLSGQITYSPPNHGNYTIMGGL